MSITEAPDDRIPVRPADRPRRRLIADSPAGLTWPERIAHYDRETGFPHALFIADDGRVVGAWLLGNDYRSKQRYHGEYPPNYLRRVKALFPDKHHVLHLFSGKVDTNALPGDTVDIRTDLDPPPTYIDDAQTLLRVPLYRYDLVLCDAPYTAEDADHYGTTTVRRQKVMRALERCRPGTHIVILDQWHWMYKAELFTMEAVVGILRSTNHRFRSMVVFRRL